MLRWIRARLSRDDGVSLVETLIAMLIVGFVLMAMAATTTTSLAAMTKAEQHTRGTQSANRVVEDMQSVTWDDLTFYAADPSVPATFEGSPVVVNAGTRPAGSAAPLPVSTIAGPGGVTYTATNYITWIDDPADGCASPAPSAPAPCAPGAGVPAAGTDTNGRDYKRLSTVLSWTAKGETRQQRIDANRAPPMDGPTMTIPFVFDEHLISPEPVLLYMTTQLRPTAPIVFNVKMRRAAQSLQIAYRLENDATAAWTSVPTPTTTNGGINWTATIPTSTPFATEGYYTFRYQATSPTGETVEATENVWIAQTDEQFITVFGFATPRTRIGKNNNNHKIGCNIPIEWAVKKTNPTDPVTTALLVSWPGVSYWVNGTLSGTTADGWPRYTVTIAQGTQISGSPLTLRAYAWNTNNTTVYDFMTISIPVVGGTTCL